jgi:hypothetical protein
MMAFSAGRALINVVSHIRLTGPSRGLICVAFSHLHVRAAVQVFQESGKKVMAFRRSTAAEKVSGTVS